MTDRYHSITVVLDREVREDDAEFILNAIRMIKGVASVSGNVSDSSHYAAVEQARLEIREQIYKIIYPRP
ncbi:hypothetical protein [Serratia quinivorans]|uniref:hypothetical protein n=1 Tax=Serratia quinivorans TaxID=137545 RepID=UPI0034C67F80